MAARSVKAAIFTDYSEWSPPPPIVYVLIAFGPITPNAQRLTVPSNVLAAQAERQHVVNRQFALMATAANAHVPGITLDPDPLRFGDDAALRAVHERNPGIVPHDLRRAVISNEFLIVPNFIAG